MRGTCIHSTGKCACLEPFFGPRCEHTRCLTLNGKECNGQGTCVTGTTQAVVNTAVVAGTAARHTSARCVCNAFHEGPTCEHKKCPKVNGAICYGHGTCDQATGNCNCNAGYYGLDCSTGDGLSIDL